MKPNPITAPDAATVLWLRAEHRWRGTGDFFFSLPISMRPLILRCSFLMVGLLVVGAMAPLALFPLIRAFGWPPIAKWIMGAVGLFMAVYALTLLPTKLVLSDEGLCQTQLFSEVRLRWTDIAEWRYTRVQDVEGFWVQDRNGKRYELKHWLVYGKRRSQQVAQVLRQRGVLGREEYDG